MDNWFKSKWFVRAVSLAFAVLLFVFVNVEINDSENENRFFGTSKEMQTIENVPVDIRIDENFVVSGVPEHVRVSLEGAKSILTPAIKQRNFDIFVDLRGLDEGEHKVEIKYANISDDLKVYIEPKTVDVVIEERSSKEFNVNVDFINNLPEGYELGKTEVNPKTVKITSSKSVIDQIAIVKVFVDIGGQKESIDNREVPINVYDSQGNELNVTLNPENVEVSAEVNNPSKTVPVSVATTGKLPDGYSLTSISPETKEVKVYGTSSVLEGIEKATTEEIDLSEITEPGTIDVDFALPDGVQVPDKKSIKVNLELEQTKTIKDVPIDVENLEDGQKVTFLKPDNSMMDVTASGKAEDVDKLTAEDITLTVNADGLNEGEHEASVTIDGPDGAKLTSEFEQITIEIT
ncbi:CdaR family protein [Lentibacillus sp. Marseille-P4043]|uniref:CdaR family protein n=1 Tax=Lentibacillus sp. Marseille-P4043 TaxID=2040293 RepID=UPI000D0B2777|nr:CdaR family protein [Lentibacillus sp. Marseille-P4043]